MEMDQKRGNGGPCNMLSFASTQSWRIATSTQFAEPLSIVDAAYHCTFFKKQLKEKFPDGYLEALPTF
jgi:hypothetical protein